MCFCSKNTQKRSFDRELVFYDLPYATLIHLKVFPQTFDKHLGSKTDSKVRINTQNVCEHYRKLITIRVN